MKDNKELLDVLKMSIMVSKYLDISNPDNLIITPLNSYSNSNYLIKSVDGQGVVVRFDNEDNSKIIDRHNEVVNSKIMYDLGLSPRTEYSGNIKVSKYINSRLSNNSDISRISVLLLLLHNSGEKFNNEFDAIELAHKYLDLDKKVNNNTRQYVKSELSWISKELSRVLTDNDKLVPCQVDMVPENILVSGDENNGNTYYIIDQEYSGMYYPEWDLADAFVEYRMTDEDEKVMLTSYSREINIKLYELFKALNNLLWLAWTLYYISKGDKTLGNYLSNRYINYRKYKFDYIDKFGSDSYE